VDKRTAAACLPQLLRFVVGSRRKREGKQQETAVREWLEQRVRAVPLQEAA